MFSFKCLVYISILYSSTVVWLREQTSLVCCSLWTATDLGSRSGKMICSIQWTVPQLSIMIIYNCTWSHLIQYIRIYCQVTIWPRKDKRKTPSQAFTRSKQIYRIGRSLKFCGTMHWFSFMKLTYRQTAQNGVLTDQLCRAIYCIHLSIMSMPILFTIA